ncbi:MAG: UDP-4-amino-4,6-dideoxy-N-acetyl-beta-L-altrosamine N-acetyltransferase, partial [Deltaproteobacteria bacterium]|nr:UDP-4-amino-4,6-dideoxy-N-acetyl-beta-L-altrosamine N-acetyltransferase [Deltaproteobacteria bacterium]
MMIWGQNGLFPTLHYKDQENSMYRLRPMNKKDIELVLEWRNRPEIRNNMYTTHVISKEEHYAYFENVWNDITKKYFICETHDGNPAGVVNFTNIDTKNKTAFWAFYSGDLKMRGVGKWMEYLALNYAFESMDLHKLSCEVLDFNYAVVAFHREFGFKIEGIFRRHHYTGDRFADVYRLSMFREDWLKYQQPFYKKLLCEGHPKDTLKVGRTYEEIFMFNQDDIQKFAELSGDDNPIHLDVVAAKDVGFDGTICHGMLVSSLFSRIIGTKLPGKGTIYLKQDLEFLQPVYP